MNSLFNETAVGSQEPLVVRMASTEITTTRGKLM